MQEILGGRNEMAVGNCCFIRLTCYMEIALERHSGYSSCIAQVTVVTITSFEIEEFSAVKSWA